MNFLGDIFTKIGIYVKWMENSPVSVQDYTLFQYLPKVDVNLNRGLTSLSERRVMVSTELWRHDPLYVLNIPFALPHRREEALRQWDNLLSRIRDESFGSDSETSRRMVPHRLYTIIGVNRATSLSREDDEQFRQLSRTLPLDKTTIGLNCQVIATLWKSRFIFNRSQDIDHETAQLAFLVLEYLDVNLAGRVKEALANPDLFRSHIPYVHIREWIKNAMLHAMGLIINARYASQPIYMVTLDRDIVSLRGDKQGLFSEYDAIVRSQQRPDAPVETAPRLMSTGYFASAQENLGTQAAIIADMMVRESISTKLSLAPYCPEPNTSVLVNELALRELLSFISTSKTLDTENRRLIQNIRPVLERDLSRVVFVARKCLITTIPPRMRVSHPLASLQIKHLGAKQILKSFRGISQTHLDVSILNNNMWIALQPAKSSQDRMAFKSTFSKIFACFDPISLANSLPKPTSKYSYKCFRFLLQVYSSFVSNLWVARSHRNHSAMRMYYIQLWSAEAQRVQPMTQEGYASAFQKYVEELDEAFKKAVETLGYPQAVKVVEVAQSAGQAMYDVFKTYAIDELS